MVGVDTKYHERSKAETPKPSNLWRYLEVAEGSGAFAEGAVDAVKGRSDFAELCDRCRALLMDQSTFSSVTLEALLDADALPAGTTAAMRDRYLPS